MHLLLLVFALIPHVVSAQVPPRNFAGVVNVILGYISLLIPLLFGLAFVVVAWGVIKAWVLHGDDPKEVDNGKQIALWGVLGIAVMAGMWGLIRIFRTSLFGF